MRTRQVQPVSDSYALADKFGLSRRIRIPDYLISSNSELVAHFLLAPFRFLLRAIVVMPPRVAKRARLCRRSWSDLPHELLSNIIRGLPAFGDRLRFRAVCQQWRRAERAHEEPPPMPWLVAAGHCVGVHDAAIHRVALPEDARAAACRGSFGNWLALVPMSPPPYQPFLLNPFTTARIQLPVWTEGTIIKIVVSSAPDSENCTVAAVVGSEFNNERRLGSVSVCRLRQKKEGSSSPWWCITKTFYLEDIVFFEGKLHAVDGAEQTYVFEDDELEEMRKWPLFHRDRVAPLSIHKRYYLTPCHGKLLMVSRNFGINRVPGGAYHTIGFKVSEVSEHSYGRIIPPPPVAVKKFDGHALFVGDACCRAFAITDEGSKIKEDQIFFSDDESNTSVVLGGGGTFQVVNHEGINCYRPLRLLQSYDLRTDCFRRYRQLRPTGQWQCVTVQRLLHRDALPPPPATDQWGAMLLLWEVMSSLGASRPPCYWSRMPSHVPNIRVIPGNVIMSVTVIVYDQSWCFTQSGRSVQEAKQLAASEAVSFLRSRFRSVLDDSPWSGVPHCHSHVSEDEYEDDDEDENT